MTIVFVVAASFFSLYGCPSVEGTINFFPEELPKLTPPVKCDRRIIVGTVDNETTLVPLPLPYDTTTTLPPVDGSGEEPIEDNSFPPLGPRMSRE